MMVINYVQESGIATFDMKDEPTASPLLCANFKDLKAYASSY